MFASEIYEHKNDFCSLSQETQMKFPTKETMQRIVISVLVTVSVLVLSSQYAVYADPIPKGWQ